jgi:hypothetical protein
MYAVVSALKDMRNKELNVKPIQEYHKIREAQPLYKVK